MSFDCPERRRWTASLLVQSLILSQVCCFGLSATSVSAGDLAIGRPGTYREAAPPVSMASALPPSMEPYGQLSSPPRANTAESSALQNSTTRSDKNNSTDFKEEEETQKEGLNFKLSPGKPEELESHLSPLANTQISKMSEAETNDLLKLLPPLVAEPAKKFSLPARSLPPPNKPHRIEESFPPTHQKTAPDAVAIQPLKIISKIPLGNVNQAFHISVNFSQPMVPISTQASLEAKTPPVSFTPKVEGQWKWYGTQILTFEPTSKKLPMATTYRISVPAGTGSVVGGKTTGPETWTFTTAPPQLVSHYPNEVPSVRPSTLLMARFDQRINIKSILPSIKIKTGGKLFTAIAATPAEIAKDDILGAALKDAPAGTTIVFKSATLLPSNSPVSVSIGPDIPSAEGPLSTHKSASFQFSTFGPFKLLPQIPADQNVTPPYGFTVRFTNPIDRMNLDSHSVQITPPIPDVQLNGYGEVLNIEGPMAPQTKYQVHLTNKLIDIFGQPLSGDVHTVNFNVGHKGKQLEIPFDTTVFSSEQKTKFKVSSVNVNQARLNIFVVRPADYGKFTSDRNTFIKLLKPVYSEPLKIKNVPDQNVDTYIDLSKWLDSNRGSLIVQVSTDELPHEKNWAGSICWVQCTNLGLDAIPDSQNVLAWVNDLTTGAPIKGATVCFAPGGKAQITDEHGLASVPIPANAVEKVLVANSGKNSAILKDFFSEPDNRTTYHWYVVTDRSPYRPGEVVNVKGILRKRMLKPFDDLSLPQGLSNVSYTFSDDSGNQIGKGQTDLNKFGAFDFNFKLPTNVNLGDVQLSLGANNSRKKDDSPSYNTSVRVAEFRRPEFELTVKNEGPSVQVLKGSTTLAATTSYFAGGNLPHTAIRWSARSTSARYSPPGWEGYEFGRAKFPYFLFSAPFFTDTTTNRELESTTDGSGKNYLRIDFLDVHPIEPTNVTISATVQDVNRQPWTDEITLLVHPSDLYVGSKIDKSFVKRGETVSLSLVSTNIDGKVQENIPVDVELYRSSGKYVDRKWVETRDDIQNSQTKSGIKPVEINVKPKLGGLYKVKTSVTDSSGRRNETINQFWVQGGEPNAAANPDAKFKLQKVMLLPEKKLYKPGDRANILVECPFAPSDGMATVWRHGLAATIPIHMNEASQTITIPIDALDVPYTTVQVDLVGSDKKSPRMKAAPAEATGTIGLNISTDERTLNVSPTPDVTNSEPGKELAVGIDVKDFKGQKVSNAEVTLAIVDDALLSLVDYRFQDPIKTFYLKNKSAPITLREREKLDMAPFLLGSEQEIQQILKQHSLHGPGPVQMWPGQSPGSAGRQAVTRNKIGLSAIPAPSALPPPPLPGGGSGAAEPIFKNISDTFGMPLSDTQFQIISRLNPDLEAPKSVQLRSNFDALAKWAPSVVTDENGHAIVKLRLPDNLTRYRIMAVASHGADQFGSGESAVTARLPLMVKPSAPRFLNYGDKFELPVVIHNQTDAPIEVNLAARATNADFIDGQGRRTTIPANDRVEVRLPAATVISGTAKFQVVASSSKSSDAAQFNIPIYTPATTEAFATYGQIESGAVAQSVEAPKDVIPDFGSLELTTSSTILETLTDAYLYLQHYPFECSEQIASRIISVALLKDLLKEFNAPGVPGEQETKQTINNDLQKLQSRQQQNGSFGLWRINERETYPYVTLHVAHALLLAKKAGYVVDQAVLDKAMNYLKSIDNYITNYKGRSRVDLKVFALYIRDLNGDSDITSAHSLLAKQPLEEVSLESLGFLLDIFAHKDPDSKDALSIQTYLTNCIVETASTAEIVRHGDHGELGSYDYRLFDSLSKVKAILLDALILEGKSPDVVTKLIRSLFGGQVKGRWRNTQENVFVLLAMRHYFDKYEKTVPDLTAEAWLGRELIGESSFKGRSSDFNTITVPMSYLCEGDATKDFILNKTGAGRLYYRLGLNYAPKDLKLSSMDRGFTVTRTYEGATKKDDVKKDGEGTWKFKSGSLVKVKLKISAPAERFFVALIDPIPAGTEALNQDLKGTEPPPANLDADAAEPVSSFGWERWNTNWWNHENKRDNETEVFADQLQGGAHEYSYLLRATTPGIFVVPPTKAEEMYSPETYGRAQSEKVIIE